MDSDIIDEEFIYGKNIEKIKKKKELILDCLKSVVDPDLKKNIVELNFIRNLKIHENDSKKYLVNFDLNLTTPACPVKDDLVSECKKKLGIYEWIEEININTTFINFNDKKKKTNKIENIILVYSCKGGVGKSFFSVNFSYYLKKKGASVGLLDADINGPSLPTLLPFEYTYAKFKRIEKKKKKSNKIFYEKEKKNKKDSSDIIKKESLGDLYFFDTNLNEEIDLEQEKEESRKKIKEQNNNKETYKYIDNKSKMKNGRNNLMYHDDNIINNGIHRNDYDSYDEENKDNINEKDDIEDSSSIIEPLMYNGVKLMSYAYIKNKSNLGFASFRGPILNELIKEFLNNVDWGILDYLIIDMPPGTNDIHLNLFESEKIDGIIMISTPNDLSINDVEKGLNMCNYFNIPIVSLIINMNYFVCDNCDKKHYIFNNGNIESLKKKINNIYEIPFHSLLSKNVYYNNHDNQKKFPFILAYENHFLIDKLEYIFQSIIREISILKYNHTLNLPSLQIYNKNYIQLCFDTMENKYVFSEDVLICHIKVVRLKCKCDICNLKKKNNKKIVLDYNLYIKEIIKLGIYNVKIIWSDNHVSIYSYAYLKHIFQKKRLNNSSIYCQSNNNKNYEW
ncbi:conserved Plasmodium protein, unknown function [Plasmodium gallinaceum]|uniref:Fe-S cluster assembly protein n=1 Tax=Plasmodium gallinaceum TaxID=5849 RepID=A0A1J1GYG6_PLAGA|nr:conserved Plasmodium protein, unknown function [Plasmodium gallinaceum]CRG96336.1 conserved Plasmodium protein, unknown function [Plasmodium gallinaceum]